MRTADMKVRYKKNVRWITLRVVGTDPKKIIANKHFKRRIYTTFFEKKSVDKEIQNNSLTILRVKLNEITGYTNKNANWGT